MIRSDSGRKGGATYPDNLQVEGQLPFHPRTRLVCASLTHTRIDFLPGFSLHLVGRSQGTECESKYVRLTPSSMMGFHLFHSETKPDRESPVEAGNAFHLDYLRETRNLTLNFTLQSVSRDFNTQAGFLTRTGITRVTATVQPKFYPDTKFIRTVTPSVRVVYAKDHFDNLYEMDN